jgi:hypothetical protein
MDRDANKTDHNSSFLSHAPFLYLLIWCGEHPRAWSLAAQGLGQRGSLQAGSWPAEGGSVW